MGKVVCVCLSLSLNVEKNDMTCCCVQVLPCSVLRAGDTVIGTLALAVATGATLMEAAVLANAAAGVTVGKFGPATLTQTELIEALEKGR